MMQNFVRFNTTFGFTGLDTVLGKEISKLPLLQNGSLRLHKLSLLIVRVTSIKLKCRCEFDSYKCSANT